MGIEAPTYGAGKEVMGIEVYSAYARETGWHLPVLNLVATPSEIEAHALRHPNVVFYAWRTGEIVYAPAGGA